MDDQTLVALLGIVIGCLNVWMIYAKTKADKYFEDYKCSNSSTVNNLSKELARVVNKQTEHDNKFVTDQRVRDIVKDEIKPLKDEVASMNINVTKIMDSLAELTMELKVTNAIREHDKERNK